jgi:hypothetical protein
LNAVLLDSILYLFLLTDKEREVKDVSNFYDLMILVPAGIILNVIIFIVAKSVIGRLMKIEKIAKKDRKEIDKLWQIVKIINVGVWVVGVCIYLFLNIGSWNNKAVEMSSTVIDQVRTQVFEKPEVIEEKNVEALKAPEVKRAIEVKIEQDESKDDYEAFLKKSLEGVK